MFTDSQKRSYQNVSGRRRCLVSQRKEKETSGRLNLQHSAMSSQNSLARENKKQPTGIKCVEEEEKQ